MRFKFDHAVFGIGADHLPLAKFSFEDVHAQRIEQVALDGSLQWPGAIDRIVSVTRDKRLRRIAQFQSDILLRQTFR